MAMKTLLLTSLLVLSTASASSSWLPFRWGAERVRLEIAQGMMEGLRQT